MSEGFVPRQPKCPDCEHQPLNFGQNTITTEGGAIVSAIWCVDCGHVISMQCMGMKRLELARPALIHPLH